MIIVNWNTEQLLRECLVSLLAQTHSNFEIIVIDNQSADGSVQMVQSFDDPRIRLFAEAHNHGYAKGNNIGFEVATGDILLTLNSDTVLGPSVLSQTVEAIEAHPEVAAVGVKQIGVDGQIQSSVRGFPTYLGILADVTALGKWFPGLDSYRMRSFDYLRSQPAPQPMGTFLAIPRTNLEKLGPVENAFDLQFPIFFNEVDLLYRLKLIGHEAWYESSIEIQHYGAESTKQVRKPMIWESHRSLSRYFMKHTRGVARMLLPLVISLLWMTAFIRAKGTHAGFRP